MAEKKQAMKKSPLKNITGKQGSKDNKGRKPNKTDVAMTRVTYHLPQAIVDKVAGYAYWERLTASEILTDALLTFFKGKKVKAKPKTQSIAEKLESEGGL